MVEWAELRPILEVCDRETGYGKERRRRNLWRRKTAAWKKLSPTLEEILVAARAWGW